MVVRDEEGVGGGEECTVLNVSYVIMAIVKARGSDGMRKGATYSALRRILSRICDVIGRELNWARIKRCQERFAECHFGHDEVLRRPIKILRKRPVYTIHEGEGK